VYIFTNAGYFHTYPLPDRLGESLGNGGKVLVSFIAATARQNLILRLKHSGGYGASAPLEVTIGSTVILLNPTKSSITIDDITLYPTFTSDDSPLGPEIWNDIIIQYGGSSTTSHSNSLHDIELLDDAGLKYPRNGRPYSASISIPSNYHLRNYKRRLTFKFTVSYGSSYGPH
jgi:hypothetical protein